MNWKEDREWAGPLLCSVAATAAYSYLTVYTLVVHFVDFGGGDSRLGMVVPYMMPIWFIGAVYGRRAFRSAPLAQCQQRLLGIVGRCVAALMLVVLTLSAIMLPLMWPVVVIYWVVALVRRAKPNKPSEATP